MKVYVLIEFTDYENTDVKGVVDTKEKAEDWVIARMDKKLVKEKEHLTQIGILTDPKEDLVKLPTGLKLGDQGYYYEEWELKEIGKIDTNLKELLEVYIKGSKDAEPITDTEKKVLEDFIGFVKSFENVNIKIQLKGEEK